MGALCSSSGPVLLPFVFIVYTPAFSLYFVTYFAHLAIALSTGLAGLEV
jgi:hypothetical protein